VCISCGYQVHVFQTQLGVGITELAKRLDDVEFLSSSSISSSDSSYQSSGPATGFDSFLNDQVQIDHAFPAMIPPFLM
jgi:hypothetical protein